jgi:hypothetical protein
MGFPRSSSDFSDPVSFPPQGAETKSSAQRSIEHGLEKDRFPNPWHTPAGEPLAEESEQTPETLCCSDAKRFISQSLTFGFPEISGVILAGISH